MPGNTDPNRPSKQDYVTPVGLMEKISEFLQVELVLDLACTRQNQRTAFGITYPEYDSLKLSWPDVWASLPRKSPRAAAWLNPPYDRVRPWAERCRLARAAGVPIVTLWPAVVCTKWYLDNVLTYSKQYCAFPRIPFEGMDQGIDRDLVICHYDPTDEKTGLVGPFYWNT